MSKVRILIASVMLLSLLISLEPAFSHSGGTDDLMPCGQPALSCHDEDDDDFGCTIAGFEETRGSIVLNLFFIGLNIFERED